VWDLCPMGANGVSGVHQKLRVAHKHILTTNCIREYLLAAGLLLALCAGARAQQQTPAPAAAGSTPTKLSAPAPIWKGDLDEITRRRVLRMLVVYSKTFYFFDKAQQHGLTYDMGVLLEKALNSTNKDRTRPIRVIFIPTSRDRLLPALAEGRGDIAAGNLTMTPERLEVVDFTVPAGTNVSEILVTASGVAAAATADELSGTSLYVRRSSSYYSSLQALNTRLAAQHKEPVKIVLANENLEDEDILEMVNAGLVNATIVDSHIAAFWRQIFDRIQVHPQVTVRTGGQIAWALRKNCPRLKAVLDRFVTQNRIGTATGNMIARRYLQNTRWARSATAESDMHRFTAMSQYFQKYATQYGFEWLLLVAQGYQESGLDQSIRSPVGAVGVMQMMPTTAQDPNINIPDIHLPEPNIHAGVKYLRFLVDQYFNEPAIDNTNRHLFAFAAYNAGPNRIMRLRRDAVAQGLDPNKWFNNVELVAARQIGRETVQYVSNIFKYYVAYKLVIEKAQQREAAKRKPA
jgi:membrane-bound lytic murein transglycosylase MltF